MDCCWTVKKKESEKMDVPPTTLTEKDDMDDQEFMVWLYDHYEERMLRTAKKYCRDAFPWRRVLCLWRDVCRRNGSFKENGGIRWPLSGLSLPPQSVFCWRDGISSREVTGNCQMIWDAGQTAYE